MSLRMYRIKLFTYYSIFNTPTPPSLSDLTRQSLSIYNIQNMNKDIATLQVIAETLDQEPMASQRVLAENAGISIGLMNAILKRFVERGWIMLKNVNLRKLSYAITAEGIAELRPRSQNFARRTFELANKYNEKLLALVDQAKNEGKKEVWLFGNSYIKFLLIYACQTLNVTFVEKSLTTPKEKHAFCIVGELNDEEEIERLEREGCLNLLKVVGE